MDIHVKPQLAVLRARHGRITQSELARLTGISPKQISALERGKTRGIDFSTLGKLCVFFHCTPADLLIIDYEPKGQATEMRSQAQSAVGRGMARVMRAPQDSPETIWAEFEAAVGKVRHSIPSRDQGRR